jgi:hypothetical protein
MDCRALSVIARYQEGDPDGALSKADDSAEHSQEEPDAPIDPLNVAYHSADFRRTGVADRTRKQASECRGFLAENSSRRD